MFDVAIDRAGHESKKRAGEKVLFRFSWFFFTWPVSPSGFYGTLLQQQRKENTLFAFIC